ncbi:MAG: glycosyltransferase family 4 protein [Planctomycetia bacterium]
MNAKSAVMPEQSRRVRVTFVVYDWPDNVCGPATWVQRLLPALQAYGIESSCLALCWEAPGPLVRELQKLGIPVRHTLCRESTEKRILWVLQQVQELRPDVFVPNLVVPALYAARWTRQSGVPTVGVLHSDDRFYSGVQDVFCCGRDVDALTTVVSVSKELHQQTLRRKLRNTESAWIPYGVSVPPLLPRDSDCFRIGYVGRLSEEQKRISDVVRALCLCVRQVSGTKAEIFGDGPDRGRVEQILAAEGAALPITLVGRVEPSRIQQHLQQMDALLLLSDFEGLPIALLEAMACGVVPVVSAMKSGIPELVRDRETGWIVGDRTQSVVEAIRILRDNTELRSRLSMQARDFVAQNFSQQASVEAWGKLLLRLAKSSRPVPLKIPRELQLPPVHPALAAEDPRAVQVPLRTVILSALRRTVKRLRPKTLN